MEGMSSPNKILNQNIKNIKLLKGIRKDSYFNAFISFQFHL